MIVEIAAGILLALFVLYMIPVVIGFICEHPIFVSSCAAIIGFGFIAGGGL